MARGKGEGSISKKTRLNKDGSSVSYYEAQISMGFDESGKRIRKTITASTKQEVLKKMQALTVSVNDGTYTEPSKMLCKEWFSIWLNEYIVDTKPLTRKKYEAAVRNHLLPAFGKAKLQKVTPASIQKFYNSLASDGKKAKTVKDVHGITHRCFEQAKRIGYIKVNPADDAVLPRAEKQEVAVLDADKVKELLTAIKGHKFESYYTVILFSGMRESEAIGLRWSDIDFKNNSITINGQLQKLRDGNGLTYVSTKNGKARRVVLSDFAMEILRKEREKQFLDRTAMGEVWQNEEGYVFVDEMGKSFATATLYNNFKRIAEKIGMPEAKVHTLRHTFAVMSLMAGDDVKSIQSNLGHASSSFTLDIYGHFTDTMKQASANRMQNYIQNELQA